VDGHHQHRSACVKGIYEQVLHLVIAIYALQDIKDVVLRWRLVCRPILVVQLKNEKQVEGEETMRRDNEK